MTDPNADTGANLMYQQLRKFINVIVSHTATSTPCLLPLLLLLSMLSVEREYTCVGQVGLSRIE